MTPTDRRLEARAAGLSVEHLSGRTYLVSSGSGGKPHIVRGAVDQPLGEWTCDCIGAAGRKNWCSHKRALSGRLGVEVRENRTEPTISSLRAPGGGEVPTAAGSAEGSPRSRRMADDISFEASIPLIQSAVKVAGDGGVRLTIDVSDDYYDIVMDFVRQARGQTFRLVPMWITEEKGESDR